MKYDIKDVYEEFCGDGTVIKAVAHDKGKTIVIVTLNRNLFNNNPRSTSLTLLCDALERKYSEIKDSRGVFRAMRSYKGSLVSTGTTRKVK
jgi:hypothetical protein